jgi:hypothetical protein
MWKPSTKCHMTRLIFSHIYPQRFSDYTRLDGYDPEALYNTYTSPLTANIYGKEGQIKRNFHYLSFSLQTHTHKIHLPCCILNHLNEIYVTVVCGSNDEGA